MAIPQDMTPRQQADIDASRYLSEMKREALQAIAPKGWKAILEAIPLIGHLVGRHPDINDLYLAAVEWEGWNALEEGRAIRWELLNPIDWLSTRSASIGAERAKHIVEIARAEAPQDQRGLIERLIRGKER